MPARKRIPSPGLTPRRVFSPPQRAAARCTHQTVVRLYDKDAQCCECQEPGAFGWVYQCSADIEDLIEYAVSHGEQVAFDNLGTQLCGNLGERKGSPSAREDTLSFLRETSQKELTQYHPDQIRTILRQRDNVPRTIKREEFAKNSLDILDRLNREEAGPKPPKPWVKDISAACVYSVCPRCRPNYHERSYLSLDAVLKGEIPPSAAVGFGFHRAAERPVADANIVKNIGNPKSAKSSDCSIDGSNQDESFSLVGFLQHHIEREKERWKRPPAELMKFSTPKRQQYSIDDPELGNFERYHTHGTLRHSPRCDNLATISMGPRFSSLPPPSSNTEEEMDETEQRLARLIKGSVAVFPQPPPPRPVGHQPSMAESLDSVDGGGDFSTTATKMENLRLPEHEPKALTFNPKTKRGYGEPTTADPLAPGPLRMSHSAALTEESVEIQVPDVITEKQA